MKTYLETGSTAAERFHPLIEPTLFYDPPYDRPLEDEFAWHLVKYLRPESALAYQRGVTTPCGKFWIDFVVEYGSRRIGFEIENLEGETDAEQEQLRDAAIVGCGAVDVLYRVRGADVLYRLNDGLALLARWEPDLFSTRGHINLNTLAAPETLAARPRPSDSEARVVFNVPAVVDGYEGDVFTWPSDEMEPQDLVLRRLSLSYPAGWLRDYDRALAHYGVSPEELTKNWAKSA